MNNWVTDKDIAAEMLRGARGDIPGFKPLEMTEHFKSLNKAFLHADDVDSVLDLGCGAADFGRVYRFFDYTGADLPHMIENVAKKKNPNLNFMTFDAYKSDFKFVSEYDLVLANAFISEIANADHIFEKILDNSKKYILIHRQKVEHFKENNVKYVEYTGYLNKNYTCSVFSEEYFNNVVEEKGYFIVAKVPSETPGEHTILIKRR
jgi:SAM-dependent methyltransferase